MQGNNDMRLLLLPFIALLLAAASIEPPTPLVILVHGRGQLGLDSATLRREWKKDLDASLASAGMPALADADLQLAWYADVLDPNREESCSSSGGSTDDAGRGLVRGFLMSLTSLVSESIQDGAREARGVIGDVLYVVDPETRCAAEARVADALQGAVKTGRPVVIVAYSLGSVVAYAHLSKLAVDAPRLRDLRLITIGSPLGVPEMREILMGDGVPAPRMPPGVRSWVNVYDPNDAFAAPLDSAGVGAFSDRPTQRATSGDPHGIGGYLRDRETGLALARALCATNARAYGAACSRL